MARSSLSLNASCEGKDMGGRVWPQQQQVLMCEAFASQPSASLAQATFLNLGEFWKSAGLKAAAVEELRVGEGGKGKMALAVLWPMWLCEM